MEMDKTYYTYISFDGACNFYIGSASCYGSPEDHQYYGSGKAIKTGEFKPVRKRVINTYDSRGLAGKAEQALIALADPRNNPCCFNKRPQGSCHTDEAGKKISEKRKGKAHSAETKAKMSQSLKVKMSSEETRAKLSEARKGENNPSFGKPAANRDNRLHKFVNIYGREVVGLYVELKTNAKQIFGFSATSVKNLKMGYRQSVNGWQYCGVIENE